MAQQKQSVKYSKAIEELEEILSRIEQGEIDVDDLSKQVNRAIELIKLCKEKIEKTEMEVKNVVKEFGL